ncbi:hypothetical protein CLPUN_32050 [Clostridium puniceum]|uniref:Uncharacterized protein n=1 Tax=Clostridium puniceum TaxID=29367 RepID=A0A1S8TD51_9CLOT|nr:hypothetical protein [Clostridium puniceum]OOM75534.1 hypothetical protein CLPUN_32050 [Clostridium puniceum]
MIKISKENLLKDTIDYEEYSENVCTLTLEELKEAGMLQCGGCCLKGENKNSNCNGCKSKKVVKNNMDL